MVLTGSKTMIKKMEGREIGGLDSLQFGSHIIQPLALRGKLKF